MRINKITNPKYSSLKFIAEEDGIAVGRAFLYILQNELHPEPFGFLEGVFVEENFRGKGIGTALVKEIIDEAKKQGCYKLICTSRHENGSVHKLYERLGFKNHGIEFRISY